ncbi:MAG: nucleotidyltransferase domain-containing protein [Flavobacteriales bacterium]|nr:nucleotidyltransferase domain-containing protein [Flavobacteriales bacterium]MBK9194883.1 nucleotidyltransferase domain-containing protein [Flavobacteriales bacterium]
MLDLADDQLTMVRTILAQHLPHAHVWAFGSRVQGRAWEFSDLDLAIDAGHALDFRMLGTLKEAFQESRLPIKVDVLDLHTVSPEFRRLIDAQRVAVA